MAGSIGASNCVICRRSRTATRASGPLGRVPVTQPTHCWWVNTAKIARPWNTVLHPRRSDNPSFRRHPFTSSLRPSTATADMVRSYFPTARSPRPGQFAGTTDNPVLRRATGHRRQRLAVGHSGEMVPIPPAPGRLMALSRRIAQHGQWMVASIGVRIYPAVWRFPCACGRNSWRNRAR